MIWVEVVAFISNYKNTMCFKTNNKDTIPFVLASSNRNFAWNPIKKMQYYSRYLIPNSYCGGQLIRKYYQGHAS